MDVRPNYYRRGGDLIDEWQREAADNRLAMAAQDARREARRRGRASGRQEWRLGRAASAVRHPLHALRASLHPRHASGVAR